MRGEIPRVRSMTVMTVYYPNDNTSINQILKMAIICQQQQKRVGKWQNLEVSLLQDRYIARAYGSEEPGNAKADLIDLDRIEDFHIIDINLFSKLPNFRQKLKRV